MAKQSTKVRLSLFVATLLVVMVFAGAASATGTITIANATGSTELAGAPVGTVVYGDYGQPANGTLKLVQIGSETQPWILELEGFNVRATDTSIINISDSYDAKIILKGESNLTGNFSTSWGKGLIDSLGNLTITTESPAGTLVVNNTASDQGVMVRSIHSAKNITIESDAEVTAIADNPSFHGRADAILAEEGISIAGENTIVKATALSNSSYAYAMYAQTAIAISSAKSIIATAEARGYMPACGLCANTGGITITDHANVTATATATHTEGRAYSLVAWSEKIIISDHANLTATATATNAQSSAYAMYSSEFDGDITIASEATVSATAQVMGFGSSAHAIHTAYFYADINIATKANVTATTIATNASSYSCAITTSYGSINVDAEAHLTATATATNTSSTVYAIAIGYTDKPITISNHANVTATATATNTDSSAKAISTAGGDLRILSGSNVTAVAEGNRSAVALLSDSANVIIEGASAVDATANSSSGNGYAISAYEDIRISSAATVSMYAETAGNEYDDAYGMYSNHDIIITASPSIDATAKSSSGSAHTMHAGNDITISSSSRIDATAKSSSGNAQTMHAGNDIGISSSEVKANATSTTTLIDEYTDYSAMALYCGDSLRVAGSATVTAVATATSTARAYAMYVDEGDILIEDDADIRANATGLVAGFAVFVENYYGESPTFTITDSRNIVAEGTNASFAIRKPASFDISQLMYSHRFTNAGTPITYSQVCNDWHTDDDLYLSNYTNVTITRATLITLNSQGGSGGSAVTNALKGNNTLLPAVIAPTRIGYNFTGWYNETTGGVLFINTSGILEKDVPRYTDSNRNWTSTSDAITLYANWTVYSAQKQTTAIGSAKVATFEDSENVVKMVAIQNASSGVTAVNITYEPNTAGPSSDGAYTRNILSTVFNITLTGNLGSDTASVSFTLTSAELQGASPGDIYLAHKTTNAWEYLKPHYVKTGDTYAFTVTGITSFSPFVPISMTEIPKPSYSSSSRETGKTIILTATPTPMPTATPTMQPTTVPGNIPGQQTQKSPAPVVGLIAGLGAAALFLRKRL